MNRNTKIFIAIAVPVVIVLIGAVVIIALSLNTCDDGKLCVALNKNNKTTNSKVYNSGLYLISPAYHFSQGLPAQNYSFVGGVQTQNDTIKSEVVNVTTELSVFVVFKFYVKEENVFKFFDAMPRNYSSDEYDISSAVAKNATPIVTEVLGLWNCTEYRTHEEDYWIEKYSVELRSRFEKEGMLFTLDEKAPVKAVFLFDGCGYD